MNNIIVTSDLLKNIFNSESKKLVGKIMKRFELHDDKETIKAEVKELAYESMRDIFDLIVTCSQSKESINIDFKK